MRYVLIKNKDIISVGSSYYKMNENMQLINLNDFGWIRDKKKNELENDNGKAKLKR